MTKNGTDMVTFQPTKTYQSIVLSSPLLQNGATYNVYTGGSTTGTSTDGLYSDGDYTAGTQASNFTISSMVTGGGNRGYHPSMC